ncbi:DNA polymerase delta subunit 3 [Blastomyces silverae]|uniref:DNA polymerase delta subunit 3 n=1 Tax=Blastomyces silverae TaxID=2060906 RepID=A0A0H1BDJ0_9EURO|nr:DNA polymerase delta subunit 3 [Blastomyces silverae]
MAANYKKYLAEKVLNEQEIVTYRSLSRALKVHSNLAKQMLYEFHRVENSKKPQSVNATYLITGTQAPTQQHGLKVRVKDGDDEIMQSSPFMSSQVAQQEDSDENDDIPTTTITLVREEDLPEAKSLHQTIFSIFMYSVEPTRLQDLNVLSDIGHDILQPQPEDPLEHGKQYGMIINRNVKRRSGLPPAPPPPVPIETVKKPKPAKTDEAPKTTKVEEPSQPQAKNQAPPASSTASSRPSSRGHSQGGTADKPRSLKRDTSNIFKAFAKSKPKVKKDTPERSSGPEVEPAEPSGPENVALDDSSEEEREDLFLDTGTRSGNSKREERKEREEKLRKMMEDEEMTDAPEPVTTEEPESAETSQPEEAPKAELEEETSAPKGRRRGRRQVMKKKTMKDAEGYLVTKEEPVWESFSEDEAPPPAKRKPAVSVTPKPSSNKGTQKTGQGNIMSFFGRKQP